MEINCFVFSVASFQLSEIYENNAKHDKSNFRRGLTVIFEQKIPKITKKVGLKFDKLNFFCE